MRNITKAFRKLSRLKYTLFTFLRFLLSYFYRYMSIPFLILHIKCISHWMGLIEVTWCEIWSLRRTPRTRQRFFVAVGCTKRTFLAGVDSLGLLSPGWPSASYDKLVNVDLKVFVSGSFLKIIIIIVLITISSIQIFICGFAKRTKS